MTDQKRVRPAAEPGASNPMAGGSQADIITFERYTATTPAVLTKRLHLVDGELVKTPAAQMVEGHAERVAVHDMHEFAQVLTGLDHSQALSYGVSTLDSARVLSRAQCLAQGQPADTITRTKDMLHWPKGPGVMLLDCDPRKDAAALSKAELVDAITDALPELASTSYVHWVSSSSNIYDGGTELAGVRGQRLYVAVRDATDIPRAGAVLAARLWLAGHGHCEVSRAGTALERTLIDASVWQTNRLDFAAGAACEPPLEQRRGAPDVHDGGLLDTHASLPDLTADEAANLDAIKQAARVAVADECTEARARYVRDEAGALAARLANGGPVTDEIRERATRTLTRALQHHVLTADFSIQLADGSAVTVGALLDDPARYHGQTCLDPLEPEYNGRHVVGKLFLVGGRANLFSQAHGGRNFRLLRQTRRIERVNGRTADATRETVDLLHVLPDYFDAGTELVRVTDGNVHALTPDALAFELGASVQFFTRNKDEVRDIDPPPQVLKQLLAVPRGLKQIKAVVSAPVLLPDGRCLDRPGYDADSQLYLDGNEVPALPTVVTMEMALAAAATLMAPFEGFACASRLDRSTLLTAVLTAIERPALPTAPAVGVDAPVQGTGKTYLARCLGALATGSEPKVLPHVIGRSAEAEIRKRLLAVLRSGAGAVVWDNVLGVMDSASIAAFLTSETFSDRLLGESREATLPTRLLLCVTGNNLSLAGDLPRRVLTCRLNAGMENPALRRFTSHPLATIKEQRHELVMAGLTLIRGYQQNGTHTDSDTASFEVWDSLCRQPVAWLASLMPDQWQDPGDALKDAVANDPEKDELRAILHGLCAAFGEDAFDANDLYKILKFPTQGAVQDMADVMDELCHGRMTAKGVALVLTYRCDRIIDEMRIIRRKRGNHWQYSVVKNPNSRSSRSNRSSYHPGNFCGDNSSVVVNGTIGAIGTTPVSFL